MTETTDPFVAAYREAEAAETPRVVEAFGNRYEVTHKVAAMPMLKFAKLAKQGMDSGAPDGGAAMYDVLRAMFTREAWARFEEDATEAGADNDELFAVVKDAMAVINGFPTSQPSPSSDGPPSIGPRSTVSSFEERKRALGMVPITPQVVAELTG